MLTRAVLQQGETEDQGRSPQTEQDKQRERSEVTKKIFSLAGRFYVCGDFSPRNPGSPVEPRCESILSTNSPGQHHGFKGVEQDGEDYKQADDGDDNVHVGSICLDEVGC